MEKITLIEDVMKHYWEPTLPQLWNDNLVLYPELEKTKRFIQDVKIVIPVQTAVNERGIGTRPEEGDMPVPSANQWDQAYDVMRYFYATMYITGQAITLSKSKDTLINNLERCMKGTLSAYYFDWERQMWGKRDGLLGAEVGAIAGNVVTVTNIHNFRKGMYLVAYSAVPAAVTNGTNLYYLVEDVNYDTSKITVDLATNLVANTLFYREGSVTLTPVPSLTCADMNGLGNVISNSNTFEDIDRAVVSQWQAHIVQGAVPGTPEPMTSLRIMKVLDGLAFKIGKGELPDLLLGNYGIRRAYKKMMDDVHVPIESMPTESGFAQGYKFSYGDKDIPMITTASSWANTLNGINTKHLFLSEGYAAKWITDNGKILTLDKGKDTYWARFKMYTNLVADDGRMFLSREDFTEQ